jgi:hypothetical protein
LSGSLCFFRTVGAQPTSVAARLFYGCFFEAANDTSATVTSPHCRSSASQRSSIQNEMRLRKPSGAQPLKGECSLIKLH